MDQPGVIEDENKKKIWSEMVAEYTESHSSKEKYDVVNSFMGEELDSSVT